MNKRTKLTIAVLILIVLTIIALSVYISVNKLPYLKAENVRLTQKVETLSMAVEIKDWQYEAKTLGNEYLQEELSLKESEILVLQVDQLAVTEMIDILEYCVTYIHWLQIKMAKAGLDYPVFIIEAVLNEILKEEVTNE